MQGDTHTHDQFPHAGSSGKGSVTLITQPFCGPGMIPSTAGCDTLLACPSLDGEQKVWIGLYWIGEWPAVVTPPIWQYLLSLSRQCRVLLYIIYYFAHWALWSRFGDEFSLVFSSLLFFFLLFFFRFLFLLCSCRLLFFLLPEHILPAFSLSLRRFLLHLANAVC